MDRHLQDGRIAAALVVRGGEFERSANGTARRLAQGLDFRDLLRRKARQRRGRDRGV